MPEGIVHRLGWWAAGVTCRLQPSVYRVVRSNLGQVLGPGINRQTLEQTTRRVFSTAVRSYYDLFRALRLPEEGTATLVEVPHRTKALARSLWSQTGGAVLVFPHLSNFDLGGHALVPYLPEMQLLTLPDPPPGFRLLNESRQRTGIDVTPLSSAALRRAIRLLRRGGLVSLAGDRPVSDLDEPVTFFGRPARVPSGHVRLALKTGAVVAVAYSVLSPETQRYVAHIEPPIEMIRTGKREEELQLNMRRILGVLEQVIHRWAEQWLMFVPVWPELQGT
jgi:KDO2-lipid IV(A) lauroyltransferase